MSMCAVGVVAFRQDRLDLVHVNEAKRGAFDERPQRALCARRADIETSIAFRDHVAAFSVLQ